MPKLPILPRRAISRVDLRGMHGWRVHIKRLSHDHVAYFLDRKHGGRAGAYRAALAWFHQALRRLPPPLHTSTRDVRSKTGQVGVSLETGERSNGTAFSCYRAVWPDGRGGYVKRSFSVGKHGKRRAFLLAVHARRKALSQLAASLRDGMEREIARQKTRRRPTKT